MRPLSASKLPNDQFVILAGHPPVPSEFSLTPVAVDGSKQLDAAVVGAAVVAAAVVTAAVVAACVVAADDSPAPVDSPADPPADSPADPPADSPADPPADSPVDPPADSPVDPPADSPADPPAAVVIGAAVPGAEVAAAVPPSHAIV